jgi:hypothetical protein
MADGPAADLIVAAARDAEGVAEWKRRWIGEQLVPERFSETLQWALALARRPSTRSFTVLADAQEVVARPQLLEAWAAQFGPDDDATLVLMAPGETLGATADALHGVFRQLGLAESDLPDLLLVPEPLGRDAERALAHGARAVLTEGPVPAAFAGLERHDAAGVADLRAAA